MDKPKVKVYILHLCYRILSLHPVVQRLRDFLDLWPASVFEKFVRFAFRENVGGVGEISFFKGLPVPHEEAAPFHASWQAVFGEFSEKTAYRHGDLVESGVLHGLAVDIVPAEEFV